VKLALADKTNPVLLAFTTSSSAPPRIIGTIQLDPVEHYPDSGHYSAPGFSFDYSTADTIPRTEQILLGLLSVDPTQQSQGIGRQLIDAGLKHAKEVMGRRQAVVYVVFQRTELREWYRRIGFVDYGEKRPFQDTINLKQDDVHFSVLRLDM
jgi:GNAT superfamily N-acetyltransferase